MADLYLNEGHEETTYRILIVEDDPVSALLLRKVLENKGFSVDHAQNGVEALQMFKRTGHRIVISDWMMPEMDGVSLCREFRAVKGPYVYVILLSAKSQKTERLEAFEAGVDDFLTKPLDREDLFARLQVAQRILGAEENLQLQKEELARSSDKLKMANNNLMIASRRFEELFSGMPMACFTFDCNGMIHEWNRSAETLFGMQAHEALLTYVWDTLQAKTNGLWSLEFVEEVFKGQSVAGREWVLGDKDSVERHLVCNVFPLKAPSGEILGAISANLDITERKHAERQVEAQMLQINEIAFNLEMQKGALEEANERLERLAITDGLTSLWNHRRFQEELENVYHAHQRTNRPVSLIFLDVDHFKQFNDTFGHPEGDVVLQKVSQILQKVSRAHEAVARYGGEEFAIILPDTTAEAATAAAERFRSAIADAVWPLRGVTASLGVATDVTHYEGAKMLIHRADTALYAAKQNGRNCTTHAQDVGDLAEERLARRFRAA